MANAVNWVVKASKLCNLRCRYCYEWDELASRSRMSLDLWRRLLESIRGYHERQLVRLGEPFESRIIWHGGEPMLLPLAYLEEVLALQTEVLGAQTLKSGAVQNFFQTNLYSVPDDKLEFIVREGIQLGVSMDVIDGVRLDRAGDSTEERVVGNMDRLFDRGIAFGAIVVLGGHTHRHVVSIYNFYESLGVDFRLLPIFDAPLNTPDAPFALTATDAARALCRLFRHWIRRPDRVLVNPLVDYTFTVYSRMTGGRQPRYDRRISEWALLVNTDGTVYQVMDAYSLPFAHGNLNTESFQAMLESPRYEASLRRDEQLWAEHCRPCRFRDACNSLPLFEVKRAPSSANRCSIAYDVTAFIEDYFNRNRVTPPQVLDFIS